MKFLIKISKSIDSLDDSVKNVLAIFRKGQRTQKKMLIGTLIIALAGVIAAGAAFWTAYISREYYEEQIGEMIKATELEWRPYLSIEHYTEENVKAILDLNLILDSTQYNINSIPVGKVRCDDSIWQKANYIEYNMIRKVKYCNFGKTPLKILRSCFPIMVLSEWNDGSSDSLKTVLEEYLKSDEAPFYPVDYVIDCDSCRTTERTKGTSNEMEITEFRELAENYGYINFYIIGFAEYESIVLNYRKSYNVFLVEGVRMKINCINGYYILEKDDSWMQIYDFDI